MSEFGKYLTIIFTEMASRVNVSYKDVNFEDDDWFGKYEWTEKEQRDFENWLADYFHTNAEARREALEMPGKDWKHCKKAAQSFTFNYGWRIKEGIK